MAKSSSKNMDETFSKLPQFFNLEPSDHMDSPIEVEVTGEIPDWVSGSLYRNGPGVYKIGTTAWNHLFDGFAVLQRWTIHKGKVTYLSSILDSVEYQKSVQYNRIVGHGLSGKFPDPCKSLLGRLSTKFVPKKPEDSENTVVNVVEFGDRLFALSESALINEIKPDSLMLKGNTTITKYIAVHLGTAHPHMLKDGTMIYYGTNMDYRKAYNFVAIPPQPADSESPFSGAKIIATVPSRWKMNISYTHSFGMTANYFVHLEQPLTFNVPRLAMSSVTGNLAEGIVTHKGESMDILVVDRSTGKRTPITYKAPNGFVFHFINCYEDSGHVIVDVCFYPGGADVMKTQYLDVLAQKMGSNYTSPLTMHFSRFVLPLAIDGAEEGKNLVTLPDTTATAVLQKGSKTVVCVTPETIPDSPTCDLSRINYDYNGVKYRYFYSSTGYTHTKKQLSKFDLVEKRVLSYGVADKLIPGEPVFVPRPGATQEDDGVVLGTMVACSPDVQSYLVVLDARTFQEVARASLPKEVKMSFTFHGSFNDKTF